MEEKEADDGSVATVEEEAGARSIVIVEDEEEASQPDIDDYMAVLDGFEYKVVRKHIL